MTRLAEFSIKLQPTSCYPTKKRSRRCHPKSERDLKQAEFEAVEGEREG
jgi:hypothetical protein